MMRRQPRTARRRKAAAAAARPPVPFCTSWHRRVFAFLLVLYLAMVMVVYMVLTSHEDVSYYNNKKDTDADDDDVNNRRKNVPSPLQKLRAFAANMPALGEHIPHLRSAPQRKNDVDTSTTNNIIIIEESPVSQEYLLKLQHLQEIVAKKLGDDEHPIRSCRWRHDDFYSADGFSCPIDKQLLQQQQQPRIVYYNPLSHERFLCGQKIGAESILELDQPCLEPARLFPVVPDITGKGMPAVVSRFSNGPIAQDFDECDIPCQSAGKPSLQATRTIDGTDWSFIFSMEGPEYYKRLKIDPHAYQKNQFYSTTSFQSEVPLPYFSWAEYKIQGDSPGVGIDYDNAIKGAVFLARNCHSINHREQVIKDLQKTSFRVDSLSSCLHNADPPPGVDLSNKKQVMQHYLFYLAFENQNVDDYITEKLWGPLEAGTVPVYMGAPNVKDHLPNRNRSVIVIQDFANNMNDLAAYLEKVANDKALYESYQTWRTQPLEKHFVDKYDFTHIHSTCRTCRWAYARLYGLGWNHANQSLRELVVPRKVCLQRQQQERRRTIQQPFVEEWLTGDRKKLLTRSSDSSASSSSCEAVDAHNRVLSLQKHLRRTVWEQDGVIDLQVEQQHGHDGGLILRIQTPLSTTPATTYERVEAGHDRLQDNHTRFTFLSRPPQGLEMRQTSSSAGIVELSISSLTSLVWIRVIVEDIDTLHQGADKVENYFGGRMKDDFYNPVEGFVRI